MINPIVIQRAIQQLLSSASSESLPILVKKASNLLDPKQGEVYFAWSYDPGDTYKKNAQVTNQEDGTLEIGVFSTDSTKREQAYEKLLTLLSPNDDIYIGQVGEVFFNKICYEDSLEINGFKSGNATTDIPGHLFTYSTKVTT